MKFREFRKTTGRNLRPYVWKIKTENDKVIIRWGLLDGATQETTDIPGDCGVKGHINYQTPEQYALFCMNREIRGKIESGYVEYINGKPLADVVNVLSFDKKIPKNLTFYKPKTKITNELLKKIKNKIWTLKRDGEMHIAVLDDDNWEIYSRRIDIVTKKFPHIIESLKFLNLPNRTILLGEMVLLKDNGGDDKAISSICRSDIDLALSYQGFSPFPKNKKREKVLGRTSFYVFDIAFYNGHDLIKNKTVKDRLLLIKNIFSILDPTLSLNSGINKSLNSHIIENKKRDNLIKKYNIGPLKIFKTDESNDIELAKKLKIEGFVLLDLDAKYGDKAYSFDGTAQRPNGIWKRKPKYEEEFIIVGMTDGSGKNRGKLKAFIIEQIHPKTGERISCGKCGGGMTDSEREEFWKKRECLIGKTIKIEFDSRQPPRDGSYALRFPVYVKFSDKIPEECISQYLEEYV